MKINNCLEKAETLNNKKLTDAYKKINLLVDELNKKDIPDELVSSINTTIKDIDTFEGLEKKLMKTINKTYSNVCNMVNKELGIVGKNYYLVIWMLIGMAVFGIPFGFMFSYMLGNYAFIGLGFSMGMPLGLAIGFYKDKMAAKENRQIDIEF